MLKDLEIMLKNLLFSQEEPYQKMEKYLILLEVIYKVLLLIK